VTPIERYRYLKDHWKRELEESRNAVANAEKSYEHWSNKLVDAEIAEKLVAEE
jgi:hypothetical protein